MSMSSSLSSYTYIYHYLYLYLSLVTILVDFNDFALLMEEVDDEAGFGAGRESLGNYIHT